ncbi:MAG TPA: ribokinase [Candidatus Limnocylindria bacterium]|nr:ribokinase [Candidatus Limnocylindria bacterium]
MKGIAVIGSINVDLVSRVPRFLLPGETLEGYDFSVFPGGKGGNQSVAASRLGGRVMLMGKIGDDQNSAVYTKVFADNGIDASCVEVEPGVTTGVAVIEVDVSSGDNRIVYIPGANKRVDPAQVDRHWDRLMACDIFLMQLEIPMETTVHLARRLRAAGKTVILDPAPAVPLPDGLPAMCDYITPNEVELGLLTGMPTATAQERLAAGRRLLAMGARSVVLKAGPQGAYLIGEEGAEHFPGYKVNAVDTTAAGDTFNAAFASALARGLGPREAVPYANAAAALSTLAAGAQGAMPTREQADAFIAQNKGGNQV